MIDYKDPKYIAPIISFIESTGINVKVKSINKKTFLPGILIKNGSLVVDIEKLKYPGDLLHEAGHIAVAPHEIRHKLISPIDTQLDFDAATHELMTLAWSYAAAVSAEIPLEVIFHPEGYKGQNESLLHTFKSGHYIGLPMLQWLGMSYDANNAAPNNAKPFPHMVKWLRPPAPKS